MLALHSGILTGAISMYQILTHIYSTVSIPPSYIESPTGFLHVTPSLAAFLYISPRNLFLQFVTYISSLEPPQKLES